MDRGYILKSNTNEWGTPRKLFDNLNKEFNFTLDVCATKENAKCERYFTKEQDGLRQEWFGNVFVNPPFSEVDRWVRKASLESQRES